MDVSFSKHMDVSAVDGDVVGHWAAIVILRAMERLELVDGVRRLAGILRLNESEGTHLELDTILNGEAATYVLIPDDGMDGAIGKRLAAQTGEHVEVKAIAEGDVGIYMSGPVMRVITVILPGCPLCEP